MNKILIAIGLALYMIPLTISFLPIGQEINKPKNRKIGNALIALLIIGGIIFYIGMLF